MQRLQQYFLEKDITAIMKIQTSRQNEDDFISWQPDKRGMLTIKSAYKLGLNLAMLAQDRGATNTRPDGARPSWKIIWNCPSTAQGEDAGLENLP
jgi:hypothetical protein